MGFPIGFSQGYAEQGIIFGFDRESDIKEKGELPHSSQTPLPLINPTTY
jgi:hypothetical protein